MADSTLLYLGQTTKHVPAVVKLPIPGAPVTEVSAHVSSSYTTQTEIVTCTGSVAFVGPLRRHVYRSYHTLDILDCGDICLLFRLPGR